MLLPVNARNHMPFVSVIIPHFNDLANLDVCLDRLARQDYDPDRFEVIVADNNSACGLAAVAELAGGRARVVAAPEQGAGPARNAGAAASGGDVLAFIDSDCVPALDWISKGAAAILDADFIGGRVDVLPTNPQRLTPCEAFEMVFAFDFESYVRRKGFTGSGNMFVRRVVFEAVGGFRKTVSEDMEWSHRAVASGYLLDYAPQVIVGHPARRDWSELTAKWRRLVSEGFAYHRQRGGTRAGWLLRATAVALSPLPHAAKVIGSGKPLTPWDRVNAIGVLIAIRLYRALMMAKGALAAPTAQAA